MGWVAFRSTLELRETEYVLYVYTGELQRGTYVAPHAGGLISYAPEATGQCGAGAHLTAGILR